VDPRKAYVRLVGQCVADATKSMYDCLTLVEKDGGRYKQGISELADAWKDLGSAP
jgi:hypothetical protein